MRGGFVLPAEVSCVFCALLLMSFTRFVSWFETFRCAVCDMNFSYVKNLTGILSKSHCFFKI